MLERVLKGLHLDPAAAADQVEILRAVKFRAFAAARRRQQRAAEYSQMRDRRFKDTDLFEQIFQHILEECYRFKLVDPTEIFVDATPVSYTHLYI